MSMQQIPDIEAEGLKIGLAFSGGGYRASCFCLGTLSYMNKLRVRNKSLLEHVVALSTVSGGTITGAAYAIGIKRGKDFQSIYDELYTLIKETDLVTASLDRLLSDQGWGSSRAKGLINAFADVYDSTLFGGARFGTLMDEVPLIHLRHMSFNATEFSDAHQFRFQWSEKIKNPKPGEPERGVIGWHGYNIPYGAAAEIRMADILAASSCFPGGFEPLNFPTDFTHNDSPELRRLVDELDYRVVGLMDGGIVDNQGIHPILLAENRMKRNRNDPSDFPHILDLIIVTDVASPYMEDYVSTEHHPAKGWRSLTPAIILLLNTLILVVSGFGLYWSAKNQSIPATIITAVVVTISLIVFGLGRFLKRLPLKFNVPAFFLKPLGKLLRLKLQVYETMVVNRKNSMLKLVGEVFLKHVRRMNYSRIYEDESWDNRRIMNAVYELKTGRLELEEKMKKPDFPEYLKPSATIRETAALAASMGTTLWFTPDEIEKDNMINVLIACGQFTSCWNLLEYIKNTKDASTNLTVHHKDIFSLEQQLRLDWESFKKDPYWMINLHTHTNSSIEVKQPISPPIQS